VGVTDEFVSDVTAALTPGKVAVVADISEEWVTPLDMRVEQIGGVVFRRARSPPPVLPKRRCCCNSSWHLISRQNS